MARTYSYDATGNTLAYSNITATYNNRGRMKTLKKGSTTATFTYDALGELVKRTGGTPGTVHYVYDEAGHLLGEYNSTGGLVQETVWLGDTPVATLVYSSLAGLRNDMSEPQVGSVASGETVAINWVPNSDEVFRVRNERGSHEYRFVLKTVIDRREENPKSTPSSPFFVE